MNLFQSGKKNVDLSIVSFLTKLNLILDVNVPVKEFPKQKLKFRKKLSITLGLQILVSVKKNLLTKYIILKDLTLKHKTQTKYKQYINLLSTLLRVSKRSYKVLPKKR